MEDTILLELRNFKIFDSFVVKENSARVIYYFAVFFCTTNFDVFFLRYRVENEAVFKDVLDLKSWDFDPHF